MSNLSEERRKILNLLSEGKINASEAEKLLESLSSAPTEEGQMKSAPKYLRVIVDGDKGPHGGKVNVRVPMNLIRAGMRLAALLPTVAHEPINKALKENGVDFDVSKVKPENLEELVQHLTDLSVDVEGNSGEKVRIFCE
ncbi:MAG: hypothetical protein JNL01_08775 [Bdellovibrionales bacterium]|nr:hypothetical protein [Bdellovibrionales bacterium]